MEHEFHLHSVFSSMFLVNTPTWGLLEARAVFENKMPRYEILSDESMAVLDKGWRRIVSEIGIEFMSPWAIDMLREAGQVVEGDNVKFDPEWILQQVAKAPSEFNLRARNPKNNVHIGGNSMVFGGVYGPPFVREGSVRRDATFNDFENFCKLTQSFDALDSVGGVVCEPNDLSLDSRHLDMAFAAATLTDKFFMGNVVTAENAKDVIRIAEILHGGRGAIEETPALISLVNCNSPLRWDDRMLDSLREYALAGQPLVVTPFLLMGAMSPVTIPATLAQQIAEALTGVALTQLVRPGVPVVFGSFLSNIDMQSGSPQFGTPESGIGLLCTGQIARHFKLPFRGGGGLNSSQTVDAQSAYQTMMTMMPTFLSGTNWVMHTAGWLEGGLVSSYDKFILDVEILQSLMAEFTPLEFNESSLAFDAHLEVGHGGHFLGAAHTMERFRDCFYRPFLTNSDNYERWTRLGSRDTRDRAAEIWQKKLDEYVLPEMNSQILAELTEFVAKRKSELDS